MSSIRGVGAHPRRVRESCSEELGFELNAEIGSGFGEMRMTCEMQKPFWMWGLFFEPEHQSD